MEISKQNNKRSKKRVGRGYGSGKGGHTAGRGQKGQKSRSGLHILFEGVKSRKSMLSRLPHLRGKTKFKSIKGKAIIVKLDELNVFKDSSKIDRKALFVEKLIKKNEVNKFVKIVNGREELKTKELTVLLPTTLAARETIESLGGKVE